MTSMWDIKPQRNTTPDPKLSTGMVGTYFGEQVASGIYFYQLRVQVTSQRTRKMVILK